MDQVQEKARPRRTPKGMEVKTLRAIALVLMLCGSTVMLVPAQADLLRRGETKLVSQDQMGLPADGGYSDVSDDGRYVAFESWDRLTPEDADDLSDVYIRDTIAGTTKLVSPDVPGVSVGLCNSHPSISADGTTVIHFSGYFPNILGQRTRSCGSGYLIHRDIDSGVSRRMVLWPYNVGFDVENARLSGDGRWIVAHLSDSDSDNAISIIKVETNSVAWTSDWLCWGCGVGEPSMAISHTGRFITFRSRRDFVPGDSDADWDIYLHDRDTDQDGVFDEPGAIQTRLANILPDGSAPHADQAAVSDDGRYVAFLSEMTRVCIPTTTRCGPIPELSGLYVRDFSTGTTEFIASVTLGTGQGSTGGNVAGRLTVAISADGRHVGFSSDLPLAPGDTNATSDAYIYDRTAKKFTLASILPQQVQGPIHTTGFSMSADARYVSFNTGVFDDFAPHGRIAYVRDTWAPCPVACPEDLLP